MGRIRGWAVKVACATVLALVSTTPLVGTAWAADQQVIVDGGFEAGPLAGIWNESSTNYETPVCSADACTAHGGSGARTGDHFAWFGGIATETAVVDQDVVIPVGDTATLSFWLEIPECWGSATDTFAAKIDGTQVFGTNGADSACGVPGYANKIVDVSAFADGGSHNVAFAGTFPPAAGNVTSFLVDDITLEVENVPPTLAPIGDKTAREGQPLTFTVSGSDPNTSDTLQYSVQNLPGATIDPATGAFSWTPSDSDAGIHENVLFSVSDGTASDSEEIAITVSPTDPTSTTLAVKKRPTKLKATGTVLPAHPGSDVTVTLFRKRQGTFQPTRNVTALLDEASAYAASFRRPSSGRCMIEATFPGDDDSGSSTASKTFRC